MSLRRTLLTLFLSSLAGLPARAETTVDAEALERRLEVTFEQVWPDGMFAVELNGCNLRIADQVSQAEESKRITNVWLADLDTRPDRILRLDEQLMGDAEGNTWTDVQLIYLWRADVLERHASEVNNWIDQYSAILFEGDLKSVGEMQQINRNFLDQMRAGTYGPFFQRNYGWQEGLDVFDGAYFEPSDVLPAHKEDLPAASSLLYLVLRGDVLEKMVSDIHSYALHACPS